VSNAELWDRLGRTDPKHTKPFQRSGGFKGTSIKPIWSYRKMTEEFGPCGTGWGINAPSFQVVSGPDGEMLVYCTVSIWHGSRDQVVFGVGGDKVVAKFASGLKSDDEAFKKAFTDGITNALKMIGVGADVHMGLFDDDKYVNTMKEEFAGESDDSKQRFIASCKAKIASFADGDQSLGGWWNSDEQKKARRDFTLNKAEVDELKALVIAKLPADRKAA